MQCWMDRLWQVVACLVCTLVITALASTDEHCQKIREFVSPTTQAFYRQPVSLIAGCESSASTPREVHVVSLESRNSHSDLTNIEILLHIRPQTESGVNPNSFLIVLQSNLHVHVSWILHLERINRATSLSYQIVYGNNATARLENSQSGLDITLRQNNTLPVSERELLTWLRQSHGEVTSFSVVPRVQEIVLKVGENEDSPTTCSLQERYPSSRVMPYQVQHQRITGCAPMAYDTRNQRQIHIIELLLGYKDLHEMQKPDVLVQLRKGFSEDGPLNTLLILLSHFPTIWKVESEAIEGHIDIVSPNMVSTAELNFGSYSAEHRNIQVIKKNLVSWVQKKFGPVVSYSHMYVANEIEISLLGPAPFISETPEPDTANFQPAFVNRLLLLESNTTFRCAEHGSMQVEVPSWLVQLFDLSPNQVALRDPSCTFDWQEGDLVIDVMLNLCGSNISTHSDMFVITNEVFFYTSELSDLGSGMLVNDDEDLSADQLQPTIITRKEIQCHLPFNNGDDPFGSITVHPDSSSSTISEHTTLYMDLYQTNQFTRRKTILPYNVDSGDIEYFEIGVTGEPRLNIVPHTCWIGVNMNPSIQLNELLENGCPVDPSFKFLPIVHHPVRTMPTPGMVKRFSFRIPEINEKILQFMVFCSLGVCGKDTYFEGIPMCSQFLADDKRCDFHFQSYTPDRGTVKMLEIGPFRLYKRDPLYNDTDNNTETSLGSNQSAQDPQTIDAVPPWLSILMAVIAFLMGLFLMSCCWLIYSKTKLPDYPDSAIATPDHPVANGHVPNGAPRNFPNLQLNPNGIPVHGMMNGVPPQMV